MPFSENPCAKTPSDVSAPLLRYIDLAKFVDLLKESALYFARSDKLGDAFEGSMTQANLRSRRDQTEETDAGEGEQLSAIRRNLTSATFINCWASSPESVAMWRLYGGGKNGLAIESSYSRLTGAIEGERRVFVSDVTYADYSAQSIPETNLLAPFLYKRDAFAYERELRALVQDEPSIAVFKGMDPTSRMLDWSEHVPAGMNVPVDVDGLVARVRLSDVAEPWYRKVVEDVIKKYRYKIEVVQSDLGGRPVY